MHVCTAPPDQPPATTLLQLAQQGLAWMKKGLAEVVGVMGTRGTQQKVPHWAAPGAAATGWGAGASASGWGRGTSTATGGGAAGGGAGAGTGTAAGGSTGGLAGGTAPPATWHSGRPAVQTRPGEPIYSLRPADAAQQLQAKFWQYGKQLGL